MLNLSLLCISMASYRCRPSIRVPPLSLFALYPKHTRDRVSRKEMSVCPPRDSSIHSNRSARADVGAVYTVRASLFDNNNRVALNAILTELLVAVRELRECGWGHVRMFWICVCALCSRYLSNKVLLRWTWYSWYSTHLVFLPPLDEIREAFQFLFCNYCIN